MKRLILGAMLLAPLGAQAADLLEIYQQARNNDPQLRAAEATRNANYEAVPLAESGLLPTVSASGSVNYNAQDVLGSTAGSFNDDYGTGNVGVRVVHPLFRKDRLIKRDQADAQVVQADAQYSQAEQGLMLRTVQAYFAVLAAQDDLIFAQAEKKAIERQLDQAQQRFDVGLVAITDVHEAKARYDQARAGEISAANGLDNAREALREIIGQPADSLARVKDQVPMSPPDPAQLDAWSDTAQQNNPGLLVARQATEIARKEIEVRRAGNYATLDLVGSYAMARSGSVSGTDANSAAIGLELAIPIYTGGGVAASTRQAEYQLVASQERLDQERRAVDKLVRNAYRGVQSAISRVEALAAAQVSAKSALEATEAGFDVGTRTLVDVLNGQRDLFRAKRDYAQSRYDYMLNTLTLFQAAGTLNQDDLSLVNGWLAE